MFTKVNKNFKRGIRKKFQIMIITLGVCVKSLKEFDYLEAQYLFVDLYPRSLF